MFRIKVVRPSPLCMLINQSCMRSQTSKEHLLPSDKSITELQDELRRLKEKEKVYLKLSQKMRDLEERSKLLKRPSDDTANEQYEDQQIERLKKEIERTITDNKKVEEDNKLIRQQMRSLQAQLHKLNQVHEGLVTENKVKRQRIQLKDEQLVEKENEFQNLSQKRNCNEIVIEEIKGEISRLQVEEEDLRNQLAKIRKQRQEQERQRQKLRTVVTQLRNQIAEQEGGAREYRAKLSQLRQVSLVVKEQLVTLIHLEQRLHQELQKAVQHYHSAVNQQKQSQNKLRLLQDELKVAQGDIHMLTDQYMRESEALKAEQQTNQQLNAEVDEIAKQAFQVWQGVKELLEVGQDSELRGKAHRLWGEISQILSLH